MSTQLLLFPPYKLLIGFQFKQRTESTNFTRQVRYKPPDKVYLADQRLKFSLVSRGNNFVDSINRSSTNFNSPLMHHDTGAVGEGPLVPVGGYQLVKTSFVPGAKNAGTKAHLSHRRKVCSIVV